MTIFVDKPEMTLEERLSGSSMNKNLCECSFSSYKYSGRITVQRDNDGVCNGTIDDAIKKHESIKSRAEMANLMGGHGFTFGVVANANCPAVIQAVEAGKILAKETSDELVLE